MQGYVVLKIRYVSWQNKDMICMKYRPNYRNWRVCGREKPGYEAKERSITEYSCGKNSWYNCKEGICVYVNMNNNNNNMVPRQTAK